MNIGEKIKDLREKRGFTLSRLALEANVSKAYLSQIENDPEKKVSADILFNIAKALGTTIGVLMGNEVSLADKPEISPSLRAYAQKNNLPEDEIIMLASINYRGKQPQEERDWAYIHQTIKTALRE